MGEQAQAGSFRDVLLVVLRQRRVILTIYLALLASAAAGIFLIPPGYRVSSKILLTTTRADISTSAEKPTELTRSQVSDAEVSSQIEVVKSRDLVEKVLRGMGFPYVVDESPSTLARIVAIPGQLVGAAYRRLHKLGGEPDEPLYWQTHEVMRGLDAYVLKKSNVIEVTYTASDPVWARDFMNHLTSAYIEWHAEMLQAAGAQDFFTKQSELLREKLARSESALRSLREKAGALAGQQAEIHGRLNEFSAELARTKIARVENEERVAFLERLQASGKATNVATPQLLELEAKRADLVGRYRPDSERVREIDQQISSLRAAISSYSTIVAPEAGAAGQATDIVAAKASLAALKGKEQALARERDEYRRQAELLDSQNFDLVRLERQVKIDEEAYLSDVRTAEESRLSDALEQSKILRLAIIEPATVPLEPVSPRKGRILLLAVIGGLALSTGVGFGRDYFDTTVKTASDIRRYANMEVLAVLPTRA